MKTTKDFYTYFDHHPASKMHVESKHYLLELYFIRDEKHFFEDLIDTYSFQLIATDDFSYNRKIIENWSSIQKRNTELIENLIEHDNKIELLLNNDKTITEIKYMLWHKNLLKDVSEHVSKYKETKQAVFGIIKDILKKKKTEQKQLLE